MSEVTRILSAIEQGDPRAAEQLLPLVYDELRKLAAQRLSREKPGQTLEATALVHEAYLRLVHVERVAQWDSRGHFFAVAAEAMRRILVDRAREKGREKRGGKLIMYHGWSDAAIPAVNAINYYDSVLRTMGGPAQTSNWLRVFMVPGMAHWRTRRSSRL